MGERPSVAAPPSSAAPTALLGTSPKLPLRTKLSYGAPSFAGAGMAIPIVIHLTIFYSDEILVPLGFIALVKALARAFDALTDPLMGWVTDHTRTRWGRRRPWIMLGAPFAALAFIGMFAPPPELTPNSAAVWFAITYILYYLFHTVYEIPHGALGPELTLDYNERNVLFGWRAPFIVGGTMAAATMPPLLRDLFGGTREGYIAFAVIFGLLLVVLYLNLVLQVREREDFIGREPNPLVPGVRRVMRNRAFRILLAVYVTGSITGAIPGLMMPYFTKYVLQPDDPDRWLAIFLFLYFGSGFVSLPIWMWLARRLGKKQTWLISFIPGTTSSLMIFFLLGPGDLMLTAVVLMWGGSAFSAGMFLGPSMQADVIDYDELYTGRRREAQYNGLWSVMTKFTVIPSMAVPLAILATYGYAPNVPQTETVQSVIRVIFALAPATTATLAFLIALRFPINQKIHEQIWAGIRAHHRGERALDPLTGRSLPPPVDRGVDEQTGWFLDHFSTRELRRVLAHGPRAALVSSGSSALVSIVIAVIAGVLTVRSASDLGVEPGVFAVLSVLVGGFAFTAFCFHLFRVRAALKLSRAHIPAAQIEGHIAITEFIVSADAPEPGGAGWVEEPAEG
jgi:GPH family glycoside/pentoside/hexuronide:cation symporter